ncbi:MAG: Arm DNA-binding domain-containing protein, partial [Sedimenticolaceae bacterium]
MRSKLWRYRCRIDGKVSIFALGSYDELSLSDVRGAHEEARSLVAEGIHPPHQRKQEMRKASLGRAHTFEKIAHAWMAESSPQWSGSYERQVRRAFEMHAFGELGETPIKRITPADLRPVIKKAAEAAPTNALMLLQCCSSVFQYAVLH